MMNKNTFQKVGGPRGKAPFNKASCVNNLTNPQNRCIFRGTARLGAAMNVSPLAHSDLIVLLLSADELAHVFFNIKLSTMACY